MKRGIGMFIGIIMLAACNKSQSSKEVATVAKETASAITKPDCAKEIVTDMPVKAGSTGIVLPIGTKLCFTPDNLEIRVTLPQGYVFLTKGEMTKPLPVYATYTCICSVVNSHCQVFYAEGMGFGCMQSSCSGSCTGKFTYGGYSVDRIVQAKDKQSFFNDSDVRQMIILQCKADAADYTRHSVGGISYYNVMNETSFKAKAKCDCEGTAACTMKTIGIPLGPKIYFCDGSCNGCEPTVN